MNEKLERFFTVKNFVRIIGIFVTGVMLLISGILFWIPASQNARCTEKVAATVTGFLTNDGESGETYAPVFKYTYNDMEYKLSNKFYTNPPEFEEGEITEIYIDPNKPYDVYAPIENKMYIAAGIVLAWAVIVFIILVLVFPAMMKLVPKEELVSYQEVDSDQ